MSAWGIQVGLHDGDPVLLGTDGETTMRPDQARRFESESDAGAYAQGMRCPWHTINLDNLEHEQSFEDNDDER